MKPNKWVALAANGAQFSDMSACAGHYGGAQAHADRMKAARLVAIKSMVDGLPDEWLQTTEIAHLAGIHVTTVREYMRDATHHGWAAERRVSRAKEFRPAR
jgi:hypothetical protein